jgi:murein DD-endopeptidase
MQARTSIVIGAFLLVAAPGAAQPLDGLGLPLLVDVPEAPSAVRADGRYRLVYELHITNTGQGPVTLNRVEVLGPGRVALVEGDELTKAIKPTAAGVEQPRTVASGAHAVVLLWLTLDSLPEAVGHRIEGVEGDNAPAAVERAAVAVRAAPIRVGAPLRGTWVAANGPANHTHHRRSWLARGGRPHFPERFAIDFIRVVNDRLTDGSSADNENYFGYGADVFAVVDATVAAIIDGIPDNDPANRAPEGLTLETMGGNTVALDLGNGFYAFYGHLQPGSIRVAVGQRVRAGDVLARLGNSGNSNAPHLHFQVGDAPSLLAGNGVAYVFDSFGYGGARRRDEIPLDGWSVTFP